MRTCMKTKKLLTLALVFCLGIAGLTGCKKKEETGAADGEELKKYEVEEVGTFYLPDGFEVESGIDDTMLPMGYAILTKDNMTVSGSRFGMDAYEQAGVPIPADLDEYSQRDGVQSGIPDGTEFAKDTYGNLYVEYVEDGTKYYQVLKKGAESYGAVVFICPEGEDEGVDYALWLSKMELK